ncbi:hypothetical protein B0H13DRAFT_2334517 [Mycena leptocephala]|nr:hypothetical protein B0H13DRAFT_2334517 [Mycena leptocephala]
MSGYTRTRRPPVNKPQPNAAPLARKKDENRAPAPPNGHLEAFGEQLEKKYNIEGNDAAQAKLAEQAAKLASEQKRSDDLQRQLAELQARFEAGPDALATNNHDTDPAPEDTNASALERENAKLKAQLARVLAQGNKNIQTEMRLGDSAEDDDQYKSIRRNVRDLVLNARINWELPWKEIPVQQKSALHNVNDWATEELVKQFIKNRRNNAYKNKWIPVPSKYGYLKANAAKRDPSAPRGRQTKIAKAGAAAKKAVKKTSTSGAKKPKPKPKDRKGKKKAVVASDDDDDEDMPMASGSSGVGEDDG